MKAKELLRLLSESSDTAEVMVVNGEIVVIEPAQQDITGRIKTFDDAVEWCKENKPSLCLNWNDYFDLGEGDEDIVAYLKLRIITAALNEGWEPVVEEGERRWFVEYDFDENGWSIGCEGSYPTLSPKVVFKSEKLALYAANQFADVYADFCGVKKGGEK